MFKICNIKGPKLIVIKSQIEKKYPNNYDTFCTAAQADDDVSQKKVKQTKKEPIADNETEEDLDMTIAEITEIKDMPSMDQGI